MSQDRQKRLAAALGSTEWRPFAAEMLSEADRIIMTARGQLDLRSQPIFALTLAKAIAAGRGEVVIDLEGIDPIDPEDVGMLVRTRSLLQSRGQHLVVRSSGINAEVLAACALLAPLAPVEPMDENVSGTFSTAGT
jgi:anti-anti-sigma factor